MMKKGQVNLETSIFLVVFIAAVITMFGYLRGSIQGNWRSNIDRFSEGQYEQGKSFVTHNFFIRDSMVIVRSWQGNNINEFLNLVGNHYLENTMDTFAIGDYEDKLLRVENWGNYEK